MRILVLGSTGMLGSAVGRACLRTSHDTYLTYRPESEKVYQRAFGGTSAKPLPITSLLGEGLVKTLQESRPDAVVNCMGSVPQNNPSVETYLRVNSLFPLGLAQLCTAQGIQCLHVTTDCVFSGKRGGYTEDDQHDAVDAYGRTKSLGESPDAMVLRSSFVGSELHRFVSLLEWTRGQRGKAVSGWVNHFWNGLTTDEMARCILQVLQDNLYESGTFHLHSPESYSKYDLLNLFNDCFGLGLAVGKASPGPPVDRTLSTVKTLNKTLSIQPFWDQLRNM